MINHRESEIDLKRKENELGYKLENKLIKSSDFENAFKMLRAEWIESRAKRALYTHKSQTEERTKHCLLSQGALFYERVIVGAGTAATMVFEKLNKNARLQTLVLNDASHPSTWLTGGVSRLMTQPDSLQAPGFFDPSSFIVDEDNEGESNPYHYTRMKNFAISQMEKQNALDMPIVNLKAGQIESQLHHEPDHKWESSHYSYRIPLFENNFVKYIYTNNIDLCLGLGTESKLSSEQISPEVERKALETQAIIYDPQDTTKLRDGLIFYGNSAGCATLMAEIQEENKTNPKIRISGWYIRSKGDFDDGKTLVNLNRFVNAKILEERNKLNQSILRDGFTLEKVELTERNQLKIHFKITGSEQVSQIICPQLLVAIAQNPLNLVSLISDEMQFKAIVQHNIPLGIASKDESIVVWGASSATKSSIACYIKDEKEVDRLFKLITDYVNTLPHECKVQPGIFASYKKIGALTEYLSHKDKFPLRKAEKRDAYYRQINAASKEEIVELFQHNLKDYYTQNQLFAYAEKIIKNRSQIQSCEVKKTSGIHSAEHLKSLQNEVPVALLNVLRAYYFPHSQDFKIPKKTSPTAILARYGIFAMGAMFAANIALTYINTEKTSGLLRTA